MSTPPVFDGPSAYKKSHNLWLRDLLLFVIRLGFEPKTHSLEGCCSIQLSYRTDPFCFSGDLRPTAWKAAALAKGTKIPKVAAKVIIFS